MSERISRRELLVGAAKVGAGIAVVRLAADKLEFFDPETAEADYRAALLKHVDFEKGLANRFDALDLENLEAALGPNLLPNPSFQESKPIFLGSYVEDIPIDYEEGLDLSEPIGWREQIEVPFFSEYVQNEEAHSGGRCVSVGVFTEANSRKLVSGAWEMTELEEINPKKTYLGGYWAKYEEKDDAENLHPAMDIVVFNSEGVAIQTITIAPRVKVVGLWRRYPFIIGKDAPISARKLKPEAKSFRVVLRAGGIDTNPFKERPLKWPNGKVFHDDVSLRIAA